MNRDLTVYTYHPRPRMLWAPVVIIAIMAILGFVRGLMGAADLSLEPGFANRHPNQLVGAQPRQVVLETIPTLTPRLIGAAPPPPKAPAPVETAEVAPTTATNAAINAPVLAPPILTKAEPAPAEAAPAAPPPAPAPPAPPAALQGLY